MTWRQIRQFLVIQAFMLWQGGFVFYSAVVVPIGSDMNGSMAQGLVTQRVTNWLNLIGIVWHVIMAWDSWSFGGTLLRRRLVVGSALLLVVLFVLHWLMDVALAANDPRFDLMHGAYLWISTAQWLLALVQCWLIIWAHSPDDIGDDLLNRSSA